MCLGINLKGWMAAMYKENSRNDSALPLELGGYEANTARDVFVLTRSLDAKLEHSLKGGGYVWRANIVLTDGQILDGWVKI
jgi:hypothetical protein